MPQTNDEVEAPLEDLPDDHPLLQDAHLSAVIEAVKDGHLGTKLFCEGVKGFFEAEPELNRPPLPVIHSVKHRVKDPESLRGKLRRKNRRHAGITPENVFQKITDLGGVRVLHLHQAQFEAIHQAIYRQIDAGDWVLGEPPKAYTWDPEANEFFSRLGLRVELKESHYTSVHYLVKPRENAPWCTEIQVRTLFEEVWGEVDHYVNYPDPTDSLAITEQLRVLSKLVGTGTRLADAIFRVHAAKLPGPGVAAEDSSAS